MEFLSVKEVAKLWGMSERSVRNYCANGRIEGAFLTGKTWNIPAGSTKPMREKAIEVTDNELLNTLRKEKQAKLKGGIYHKTQINLTFNSNHIEGSKLSEDQTRFIYETNTIGVEDKVVNVDDVIETANHFKCIDYIIDNANEPLTEKMIKDCIINIDISGSSVYISTENSTGADYKINSVNDIGKYLVKYLKEYCTNMEEK